MNDDAKMIQLLWERSDRALEVIARAYGDRCLHLAEGILHSKQDAEECVNDAYLQLWRTIPPTTPDSLEAYLLKTVRNLCLNRQAYILRLCTNLNNRENNRWSIVGA